MNYNEFNKILNSIFFDRRFKQLPIYLDLEDNIKEELSVKTGISKLYFDEQFGQIVKSKLSVDSKNPFYKLDLETKEWSRFNKSRLPPPYTSLLCLLSLAAERMNSDEGISPTNYYVRLNEILGLNENEILARSLKNNSRLTERFWLGLNKWLVKNDFDFGIPTARTIFSNWKYVSYAWSQALIRDADRSNLETFFLARNLFPKQIISEMEMQLHLNEWMMPGKASINLLRIWNDENTKDKVIDASIDHLKDWEGDIKSNQLTLNSKRELLMIGSMSDFPLKLNLEIVSYGIKDIEDYKFTLDDEEIEYQSKFLQIFKENIKEFSFNNFLGHDFAFLNNIKEIFGYFLQTKIILKSDHIKEKLQFNPKPIRVLLQDENSLFFKESSRVVFFKKHLIICPTGWSKRVNEHLLQSARPNFKKFDHSDLKGLPDNWVLFSDVEILSQVETTDHLNALVPFSDGSILELSGGLKFNQSFYHSHFPPIIQVSSNEDQVQINFREEKFDGLENEALISKKINGVHEEQIEHSLSKNFKNLKIILLEKGKKTKEKVVNFRNANSPKYMNFDDAQLNYFPSSLNLGWPLSANKINEKSSSFINGMIVDGLFENNKIYEVPKISFFQETLNEQYSEIVEYELNKYSDLEVSNQTCIARGYHIFGYPSYNQFRKQKKIDVGLGKCKECDFEYIKMKKTQNPLADIRQKKSNLIIIPLRLDHKKIDIDYGLFDSLCYLGEGSWNTFINLSNIFKNEAFFPKTFLRDLVHLGHLDVEYNKNCQPILWKVNPPCFIDLKNNSYFLSGFRNERMIEQIQMLCKKFQCEFIIHNNKNSVSSYFIKNLDRQIFLNEFCSIKDDHGRFIELVENYGLDLIKMLPSISETLTYFNPVHIETKDQLECFSPEKGKWLKSDQFDTIGSYRIKLHGQRYFIKMKNGNLIETFHEIAKIYSCILKGLRLHHYNENTKEFTSHLGCEPPTLYSRVLVSNSGQLPRQKENLLIYENIEARIGHTLMNKLYYKGSIND